MKKIVALVSGGLDSTTILGLLSNMDAAIHAISFDYGQNHNIELDKVKELVKQFSVNKHKIIKVDLKQIGGSALTDDIKVPEYQETHELNDEIPSTYVPARNTIFLSLALGYAEIIGSNDIYIGVNSLDYSNYPDCRPEYIEAFEKLANLATATGIKGEKIKIHTPLINLSKKEIIKLGLQNKVDYSKTVTCYQATKAKLACGKCHACLLRKQAFKDLGLTDPIFLNAE